MSSKKRKAAPVRTSGGTGTAVPKARRDGGRPVRGAGVSRTAGATGAATSAGAAGRRAVGRGAPPAPAVVVAEVPVLARVAGAVAALGALLQLVVPALPLVTERGGGDVGAADNAFDVLPPLLVAAVVGGAGALCVLGRLPRLGLAVVAASGACSAGLLLQALYVYDSGGLTSRDLPLPVALVRTFRFEPAVGLRVLLAAHLLGILALLLVVWAWQRTWMEDEGGFDELRPFFTGLGFFAGFLGVAGVCLAPGHTDIRGLGTPAVLERDGLNEAGAVVLALALVVCAVIAPTLRPRLATVGMYLGLAAVIGAYALRNALLVRRSHLVETSLGSIVLFLAALGFLALAGAALRMSRQPQPD